MATLQEAAQQVAVEQANIVKAPEEMTQAELKVELDKAIKSEADAPEPTEAKPTDTPAPEAKTEEKKQDVAPPAKQDEAALKHEAEIKKLKRQTEEQDRIIRRHSNEVGAMRELAAKLGLDANALKIDPDAFAANANEYIGKLVEQRLAMEKLKAAQIDLEVDERKVVIQNRLPDIEEHIEDMAVVAKTLGVPESTIVGFKNEWWRENLDTLLPLYAAAKNQKAAREAQERLKVMEVEMAALKKRPAEVVKKLAANASEEQTLTANAGTSRGDRVPLTDAQISNMSQKELKEYLAEMRRKGEY